MKIEVGKYYKTRDGRKVGPMIRWGHSAAHPFEVRMDSEYDDIDEGLWSEFGSCDEGKQADLIAEWDADSTPPQDPTPYEIAAQYKIIVTVTIGEITVSYDGRDK